METWSHPLNRLRESSLAQVGPDVRLPRYDRAATTIGVVHFGPGAFHRAHQAAYFDRLLAADPRWAICAVSLRTPDVAEALRPQDGLYTLVELGKETRARVIGAIREVLVAAWEPGAVAERLASADTRLVTLTVTEKGYCLTPGGDLDLDHPDIVHDLAEPAYPKSVVGWLVEGLARRKAAGLAPFTVLSCDNLPANGRKLRGAVLALAGRRDPALAKWIAERGRFPCSMVDSITPATDDALRTRVAGLLGLEDAWPVQREPFSQWVIEDDLGPDRDALAVVATLSDDVEGWERAKLRLLNGAHSTLAYVGLLRGHQTVRDAMDDIPLAQFVARMMLTDITRYLQPTAGLDMGAYIEALLERFRNPAIEHKLSQIAWDGSQKLPIRILASITDALEAGHVIPRLAVPVAAWMRFVVRQTGSAIPLTDPLAAPLAAIGKACNGDAERDVARFLALEAVFPPALAGNRWFVDGVTRAYARLPELP